MAVTFREVNVDAMLRKLTAKQFLEWEAFASLEPFGEQREDYRTASIVAMLANIYRGKDQPPYPVEDFLLKFKDPEERQSREEKIAIIKMIVAAYSAPGVTH